MSDYWRERFTEEENRVNQMAGKEIKNQQIEYDKAITRINQDIEIWYNRIAKNNNVTLANAKELLNKKEREEFKWTVEEYIKKGSGKDSSAFVKELENASAKYHIERLEAMKLQVRAEIEKLYNGNGESFENYLGKLYKDQYNHTFFEIAKGTGMGVGSNMYKLNDKLVNTVISNPWASDGKHFSDRLWEDKTKLVNALHTEMTQAFIRGDKLDTLIEKVVKRMNASRSNVARLVYTESAAYAAKARLKTYEDLNVEHYEIVATLDSRTSEICQGLDGKVFGFKEYEIGTTAPPFHVNCRTTTAPYFEDDEEEQRVARDEDGKTYYVPGNMKYEEWKSKYLKNSTGKMLQKDENGSIIELDRKIRVKEKEDMEPIEKLYEKIIKREPEVTEEIMEISKAAKVELKGLEYRIKTKESLFRKIEKDFLEESGVFDRVTIFNNMKDILRYTFVLPEDSFLENYMEISRLISSKGYEVIKVGNTWKDGAVYKGINTVVERKGLKIEIQYHTSESYELKNGILHKLYEEYRDINTEAARKKVLIGKMIKLSLKIKNPKGVETI